MGDDVKQELLPCPFCGKQPHAEYNAFERGRALFIECLTADCVGPHISYYDGTKAAAAWNRRISKGDPNV